MPKGVQKKIYLGLTFSGKVKTKGRYFSDTFWCFIFIQSYKILYLYICSTPCTFLCLLSSLSKVFFFLARHYDIGWIFFSDNAYVFKTFFFYGIFFHKYQFYVFCLSTFGVFFPLCQSLKLGINLKTEIYNIYIYIQGERKKLWIQKPEECCSRESEAHWWHPFLLLSVHAMSLLFIHKTFTTINKSPV